LLVPITVNVSQVAHHLLPHNTYWNPPIGGV
jgi:hypothetical protein